MCKPSHKRQLADVSRLERLPGSRPALPLAPICAQHLARVVTATGKQALQVLLAQIPHIEIRFCNPALARFETRDRIFVQGAQERPDHQLMRLTPRLGMSLCNLQLSGQLRKQTATTCNEPPIGNRYPRWPEPQRFTQHPLEFHGSDGYGNLMPCRRQRYSVRIRRLQSRWPPKVTADRAGSPVFGISAAICTAWPYDTPMKRHRPESSNKRRAVPYGMQQARSHVHDRCRARA